MEKVSIIVPVYNVDGYVEKCINSLISQTYKNIEIFLIDDGSTDNSGKICKEYSKRDRRIKYIYKENGGQGSARNIGLNQMTGQYVCFVDSDDYVDLDYVDFLIKLLKKTNADISACNNSLYDENGNLLKIRRIGKGIEIYSNIDSIKSMWYGENINIGPWAKLYKKELWNDIRFKECFSEDFATMHKVFIKANKVSFSYESKLNYLVRNNSDIRSNFNRKKLVMLDIANCNIEFANNYSDLKKASLSKAISVYFHVYFQLPKNEYDDEKKRIIKFIKANRRKVLFDKRTNNKTKIGILASYVGFEFAKSVFYKCSYPGSTY